MSNTPHGTGSARSSSDRRYSRQRVSTLEYIELGKDNGGIVLNIAEGGVAITTAVAITNEELPNVRFRLPGSSDWIETSAQVAWTSPSKREAGIQFVRLRPDDQNRIRSWISSNASPKDIHAPTQVPPEPAKIPQASSPIDRDSESAPATSALPESATPSPAESPSNGPEIHLPVPGVTPPIQSPQIPVDTTPRGWAMFDYGGYQTERFEPPEERSSFWLKSIALVAGVAIISFALGVAAGRNVWGDIVGLISGQTRNTGSATNPVGSAPSPPSSVYTQAPNDTSNTPPAAAENAPKLPVEEIHRPDQVGRGSANGVPPMPSLESRPEPPSGKLDGSVRASDYARYATRDAQTAATPHPPPVVSAPTASSAPTTVPAPAPPAPETAVSSPNESATLDSRNEMTPPAISSPEPAMSTTGSVEVISNPYPSLRVPPGMMSQASRRGRNLQIGPVVSRVEPTYPPEALRQRMEGTIKLHVVIGRDGTVNRVELVSGPLLLADAARGAVQQWRYRPTLVGGQPVESEEDITMVFRLTHPPNSAR